MNHYPEFFRASIQRTLHQSLAQVQGESAPLSATVRDQALHILTFALKLDEAWALTRTLLFDLAPKLEQMGHRSDWLLFLENGFQCGQRYGDTGSEAEIALHIGHLYRLSGNFANSHTWLQASVELFVQARRPQGQARALNQLAYLAFLQREYQQATAWAYQALDMLRADDTEQADVFNTLGVLATAAQQRSVAKRYHQQALQIRQQQGDRRRAAWSLQNLGSALREQGDYTGALAHYQEALVILEALPDVFNAAIVTMNLGIVYAQQNEHTQALRCYARAAASFGKTVNHVYRAKVHVNWGLSYLALAEWQAAEQAFLTGATLFQDMGDPCEAVNALDGLGLVYLHQGLAEQALAAFTQALAHLSSVTDDVIDHALYEEVAAHRQQAQALMGQVTPVDRT